MAFRAYLQDYITKGKTIKNLNIKKCDKNYCTHSRIRIAGYSPIHLASAKVTSTLILPWSSLNSLYTADGDVGRLKNLEGQTSIFLSFLVSAFYSINCGDVLPPPVFSQFRRPCCTTVTADIITIYLCIWICRRATEYTLKLLISFCSSN